MNTDLILGHFKSRIETHQWSSRTVVKQIISPDQTLTKMKRAVEKRARTAYVITDTPNTPTIIRATFLGMVSCKTSRISKQSSSPAIMIHTPTDYIFSPVTYRLLTQDYHTGLSVLEFTSNLLTAQNNFRCSCSSSDRRTGTRSVPASNAFLPAFTRKPAAATGHIKKKFRYHTTMTDT